MRRLLHPRLLLLGMMLFVLGNSVFAQFSYNCGFENSADTTGWKFVKRPTVTTKWMIGSGTARFGSKSMYVSADGVNPGYNETSSGYYIAAYKQFTLPAGNYTVCFDWKALGESPSGDAMMVGLVPSTETISGGSFGTDFPNYIKQNTLTYPNTTTTAFSGSKSWTTTTGTITIATAGIYSLTFVWKTNGGSVINTPGACVDNIYVLTTPNATDCNVTPSNFTITNTTTLLNLSWQGNAPVYEISYYSETDPANNMYTVISGITTTNYSIALSTLAEGVYNFRVKGICGTDTSLFSEVRNKLVYDPLAHCLDYLNFNAAGVVSTYGTYSNPFVSVGAVDYGYESTSSRHTIHYIPNEYDQVTGGLLKTVPTGAIASVRLGNRSTGSEAESITYDYTVDASTASVLLLKYAAVLEDPGHDSNQQPRFRLQILNTNGQILSTCTEADFTAAAGRVGWNNATYDGSTIRWKDWTTIGVNLEQYDGMNIRIRVISYDCSLGAHFGYAYFTLDCVNGVVGGIPCDMKPTKFTVPEGFIYRWYRPFDHPSVIRGTADSLLINATDTATYKVDLVYPENPNCYFTLTASAMKQKPAAKADFKASPANCQNIVNITNKSGVFGYYGTSEVPLTMPLNGYFWDFGPYGTSTSRFPKLILPNAGDTIDVILRVSVTLDSGICEDIDTFRVEVPAISESYAQISKYICQDGTVTLNGKVYTKEGVYVDTLKSYCGCDSLLTLKLDVLKTDTIALSDTICSDQTYPFFNNNYNTTGHYTHSVKSSEPTFTCDSLYYTLDLLVNENLEMKLGTVPQSICADDPSLIIPYSVQSGLASEYQILYDSRAKAASFEDSDILPVNSTNEIAIGLPTNPRPGNYAANLIFYNRECGNKIFPINFTVMYASSVVVQRWNDVLGVRNSSYNGGYNFSSYRWYKNGTLLENEVGSILYLPENMEFGAAYQVELTRSDDGITMLSCPIYPEKYADSFVLSNTVSFVYGIIFATSPQSGIAKLYNYSGMLMNTYVIKTGENALQMPSEAGIYILNTIFDDGSSKNFKLDIKK